MEKSYFAVLAIGEDEPGIVAAITKVLAEEYSCNVETSQMTIVGGHFASTLIASTEVERKPEAERRAEVEDKAKAIEESLRSAGDGEAVRRVYVNRLESKSFVRFDGPEASHSITAWAGDQPGVLHSLANALAEHNVNITALCSGSSGEDDSLCVMTLDVTLPGGMHEDDLSTVLENVPHVEYEIEPVHLAA